MPCYNPIEGWEQSVLTAMQEISMRLSDVKLHLILVNDGSSAGILPAHIERLQAAIPNFKYIDAKKNGGKGQALRLGMAESKQELCIFTDIDFPYTTDSFITLYERLASREMEVVVGARDERYYDNVPSVRVRISKFFKFFVGKFFSLPVQDTQCGLKGMGAAGRAVFQETETNRYLFDLEFIHLFAKRYPGKLCSVPVKLKPGIVFSRMNFRILASEGLSFLMIFFRHLFRRNKKAE